MSSPQSISFSLMDILTKENGLKEILTCPSEILMLLQNVGEIFSIIKFLMLLRIYGKIIISQVAQIEFLFLVPDPMLMPLFTCGQQIILIQEVFSPKEKLRSLSHFYIVDFVTSMLFTMSMNVMTILQRILMMVIHLMLLPLIDEWPPQVTTDWRLLLLSPIFLACTTAKMLQCSLLAFSHLKVYCFTDGLSKSTITTPCVIFWFRKEILLVLWSLVISKSWVFSLLLLLHA